MIGLGLGPGRARELSLLPGPFDASRAAELGLVTQSASADSIEAPYAYPERRAPVFRGR